MSNETDLDWLARNVHAWPKNTPQVIASGHDKFEFGATFFENHVCLYHRELADSEVIHKHQWLARRAELQNKPSWEGARNLVKVLQQYQHETAKRFDPDQCLVCGEHHNHGNLPCPTMRVTA